MPEDVVDDFPRMLEEVDLTSVRCYEISARARDGFKLKEVDESEDRPVDMRIRVQVKSETLGVRTRTELTSSEVEVRADIAVFFKKPEGVRYSHELVNRFVKEVALFALFPFAREAIADATRRVGVEPHVLGLLHMKDVEFADDLPVENASSGSVRV
ncbi:hypothetical protein AB0F15_00325 [Amycolatopsis sp. NPDC026612]|uniref:hypothetical protein n=1 Tax=Amycolatopsis sp. NPDC026612 TaxID=3155466 RepID=UPI0033D5E9F6